MDHKIQYSDIWVSTAWALLKKMTGPADRWRAEFCWSTGSYMDHRTSSYTGPLAVTVVMDHRTSSSTGPLAVSVVMDHRTSSSTHSFSGHGPPDQQLYWSTGSYSHHGPPDQQFYWSTGSFSGQGPLDQQFFWSTGSFSGQGPPDQQFYWSTGSFRGHGPLDQQFYTVSVVMDHWTSSSTHSFSGHGPLDQQFYTQFQWSWTTGPAGISSPLCSFYSCCPYFISDADATTGSHHFERLLQITIRKLNSSTYTLQEQTILQELGKEDRYAYLSKITSMTESTTDNSSGTRKGRQVWISLKKLHLRQNQQQTTLQNYL